MGKTDKIIIRYNYNILLTLLLIIKIRQNLIWNIKCRRSLNIVVILKKYINKISASLFVENTTLKNCYEYCKKKSF